MYGKEIKEARKKLGITQKELAERLGTTPQNLAQYENNKRNPKLSTVYKIADALDVRIEELIGLEIFNTGEEFDKAWNKTAEQLHSANCENLCIKNHVLTDNDEKLLFQFLKLNNKGQEKAIEQVELLTKIQEYKQNHK